MKYEQIAELLNGIAERFGWDKNLEGDNIIELKQGNQSIVLEPGGQFEHRGVPLETVHQIHAEVDSHLCQSVLKEIGIGLVDIAYQPKWEIKDIPLMPKLEENGNPIKVSNTAIKHEEAQIGHKKPKTNLRQKPMWQQAVWQFSKKYDHPSQTHQLLSVWIISGQTFPPRRFKIGKKDKVQTLPSTCCF